MQIGRRIRKQNTVWIQSIRLHCTSAVSFALKCRFDFLCRLSSLFFRLIIGLYRSILKNMFSIIFMSNKWHTQNWTVSFVWQNDWSNDSMRLCYRTVYFCDCYRFCSKINHMKKKIRLAMSNAILNDNESFEVNRKWRITMKNHVSIHLISVSLCVICHFG